MCVEDDCFVMLALLLMRVIRALSTPRNGRSLLPKEGLYRTVARRLVYGASAELIHCPWSLEASSGRLLDLAEAAGQPLTPVRPKV